MVLRFRRRSRGDAADGPRDDIVTVRPQVTESTVDDFRRFRITVAHDVLYYDASKRDSLARKICSQGEYLEVAAARKPTAAKRAPVSTHRGEEGARLDPLYVQVAAAQLDSYGSLRAYVGTGDDPWPIGVEICTIALIVWMLTVTGNAIGVASTTYAVLAADRGGDTRAARLAKIAWGLSVQAVRLGICTALGWFGALYLVNTLAISDLILNAVALAIVMEVLWLRGNQ